MNKTLSIKENEVPNLKFIGFSDWKNSTHSSAVRPGTQFASCSYNISMLQQMLD